MDDVSKECNRILRHTYSQYGHAIRREIGEGDQRAIFLSAIEVLTDIGYIEAELGEETAVLKLTERGHVNFGYSLDRLQSYPNWWQNVGIDPPDGQE